MKKILLTILILGLCAKAQANTISLATISADATAQGFNNNFTIISNAINGNIEGSTDGTSVTNIKADSVYEINMADDANSRIYANEALGIGTDTTTAQTAFVFTGLTPATDTDLTSDISAGTAYINGYRVVKTATSHTYTASMDTYVDLSQAGTYTFSEVSVGATAPSVAANSARLAKVTTNGTQITAVTDLANRRIPGLIIPAEYRVGLVVSKDSATTVTVLPGSCEINSTLLSKTATTSLSISTAGDWAGGSSLRAANTFGFVGIDEDGSLKLHTTAPTHANYDVSLTVGKKRYATWSSTVYRILGWFRMDGSQNIENASNIREADVPNVIVSEDTAVSAFSSATFSEIQSTQFYSSGGPIILMSLVSGEPGGSFDTFQTEFHRGGTGITNSGASGSASAGSKLLTPNAFYLDVNRPQGTTRYGVNANISGSSLNIRRRSLVIQEE